MTVTPWNYRDEVRLLFPSDYAVLAKSSDVTISERAG